MMAQATTDTELRAAQPDSAYQVRQTERHADALGDLILSGTLTPDGLATAHGARGLLYALIALRDTIATAAADTADAVTDLDATLGIVAGAITDMVTGDELPAALLFPRTDGA
jgi:hypothetical protein